MVQHVKYENIDKKKRNFVIINFLIKAFKSLKTNKMLPFVLMIRLDHSNNQSQKFGVLCHTRYRCE